ncbi:MAG: hypothetical protein JO366_01890 [Methylobacteriaceae bacterium]|nr:hypothetical protein [Methylobacteriaceae bacterium]MBV9243545.1 hypothetical protein [Methylobacteriaceae bacterium]MBV9637253.1 hypothetical protein [Methylobacteriaceae bacterium]
MSDRAACEPGSPAGHESAAVATSLIVLIGAALLGLVLVGLLLIAVAYRWREGRLPYANPAPPATTFPEPRLQLRPFDDLARLRREEDAKLGPKAAIPIERAMQAIARRGQDAYAPLVPPQPRLPKATP